MFGTTHHEFMWKYVMRATASSVSYPYRQLLWSHPCSDHDADLTIDKKLSPKLLLGCQCGWSGIFGKQSAKDINWEALWLIKSVRWKDATAHTLSCLEVYHVIVCGRVQNIHEASIIMAIRWSRNEPLSQMDDISLAHNRRREDTSYYPITVSFYG